MLKNTFGSLFLIPNLLSDDHDGNMIAEHNRLLVRHLRHFIVENEKPARALLKKMGISTSQGELTIFSWNLNSDQSDFNEIVRLFEGNDVGLISDAGLPCVADPGSDIVAWAHSNHIRVIPLPGSSSIMLALMASGFNGQSFVFHGYLPIDKIQRRKKLRAMEMELRHDKKTQIFMETPYRNNGLLDDLTRDCAPSGKLCIACDISSPNEFIKTQTLEAWKKDKPDLHKRPAIFILG